MKLFIISLAIAPLIAVSAANAECSGAQTRSGSENPHVNLVEKHAGVLKSTSAPAKEKQRKTKGNGTQ